MTAPNADATQDVSAVLSWKLAVNERGTQWVDANGVTWQWTNDNVGWQAERPKGGWTGSFQTVEGCGPFHAKVVATVDVTPEPEPVAVPEVKVSE